MKRSVSGFTIVELLIVIVVIAVLAAISYVVYTTISNRANDAAIQSDLKNLATILELRKAEKDTYIDTETSIGTITTLNSLSFRASTGSYDTSSSNLIFCYTSATPLLYAAVARSKSGSTYYVTSDGHQTPRLYEGSERIVPPIEALCDDILPELNPGTNNYRGFAPESNPQWRPWTQ